MAENNEEDILNENDELKKKIEYLEDILDLDQEIYDLSKELDKLQKEDVIAKMNNYNLSQNLYKLFRNFKTEMNSYNAASLDIAKIQAKILKDIADDKETLFSSELELLKIQDKYNDLTGDQLSEFKNVLETVKTQNDYYLRNKDALKETNKIIKESQERINGIKQSAKDWWMTIKTLTKGYGAQIVFFGTLIKKAHDFYDVINDTRKELGLTLKDSISMLGTMSGAIFSLEGLTSGIGIKESAEAYKALVKETGNLDEANKKNVIYAGKLMSLYGLSADEAAKLTRMTKIMGSYNLDNAKALAKANNVPIGEMMKDVVQNTETFAKWGKKGGDNIFKASVIAKKLGIELQTVAQIADSMLMDPTGSIEQEMETSVLLGKQLDLMGIRQKMYAGDMEGATKDLINQLGGIEEFNNMDIYQKQAVADLLGVQVDQVQKLMDGSDKVNTTTGKIWGFWDKMGEVAIGTTGSIKEWGLLLASAVGSAGQFLFNFKMIKDTLGKIIPLQKIFNAIGGGIKSIFSKKSIPELTPREAAKLGPKEIMKNIKPTSKGTSDMVKDIKPLASKGTSDITKNIDTKATSNAVKSSKLFGKINMGDVVKGALAMAIMSGALWVFAKALQEFAVNDRLWESIGAAATGLLILTGALAAMGAIMMSGVGAVALIAGAAAMGIMAGGLWIFGKALQEITKAGDIEALGKGLLLLSPGLLALAGAGVILGLASPLMFLAAGAITMIGLSLLPLSIAIEKMSKGLPALSQFMSIVKDIKTVPKGVDSFFDSIASGIFKISDALDSLKPKASILDKLSKLSNISMNVAIGGGNTVGGNGTAKGTTIYETEGNNSSELLKKLDSIIELLNKGHVIEVDGVRLMKVMAKNTPAQGMNSSLTSGNGNY